MAKEPNDGDRLYRVLNNARGLTGGTVVQKFSQALELPMDDVGEFFRSIASLHELLARIGEKLRDLEGDEGPHVVIFRDVSPLIRRAITIDALNGPWENQKQLIKAEDLMALRGFAATLSTYHSADAIAAQELEKLRTTIKEVEADVLNSELPPILKALVLEHVSAIRRAVDEYRIWGVDALRNALALNFGMIIMHKDEFEAQKGSPAASKYFALISAVNLIVTTALHAKELAVPFVQMLAAHVK